MIQRPGTRQHGACILPWLRFCLLAMVAGASAPALAAAPDTITSLAALHSLTGDEASQAIPVAFEATVTYHIPGTIGLFVQDGGLAIYADAPENVTLAPGDRVLVRGKTRGAGFRPDIVAESVTVLGHGPVPAPVPASYPQLIRGDFDCLRVSVHGTVRSADLVTYGKVDNIYLELSMDGGPVDAIIDSNDGSVLGKLPGAEVEVAGSTSGIFDSKQQLTGIVLKVPALSDLKILKEAPSSPDALPITPMDEILGHSDVQDLSERVRVQGTITYYLPGAAAVLQNGARSLWIETRDEQPLTIGDRATASGYPAVRNGVLTLANAEVEDSHQRSPLTPQRVGWDNLYAGTNAFNLISTEGQVVKEGREEYQDEYLLTTGGHLFTVLYRHIDEDLGFRLPPMKQIPVGAVVRVTGITSVSYGSNPFEGPAGFDVLLRSFDDIKVVAKPSWLNVNNLTRLVQILLTIIFMIGIVAIWTERQARLRNAARADIERRRAKILEEINNSRPLAEILETIHSLVSARLGGAACWIQVKDGATLGNFIAEDAQAGLRVVEEPILSRSGPALGAICAAFGLHTRPRAVESEALAQAAGLARLAIETSRLYSDLVHRSEFDLLTDIHNRFSFEKQIEIAIEAARQSAGIFGLLYIDLDEFKQVNDQFGHHTGDLYLQEVALRMKRQLRPGDILARLGGDEFAAILPQVRNRAEVEEITLRLERCFEQPFVREGCTVHGTASIGIAIYPADGATRDSLLSTADAAMYVIKQTRRQNGETSPTRVAR
ncbi:MAG TPA: GGDEF domain-containing protein [Acidobacteriaceae bacterium]|nr:GGDEF domain-containing protein [Acidobacteriaceae bacterium]